MKSAVIRLCLLVVVCLLTVQLAACGSGNKADGGNNDASSGTNSGGDAPKAVTLRIMDWSDSTKAIREEFHKKFMEKYPHIKIEYTTLSVDQFKNTILTAVKSGEAPDLFPVPSGMQLSTVVADGWFQPMDPYIDDEFKSIFEEGIFQNGITMVDGKVYSIPEGTYIPNSLVFYNKTLFKEAGLDPEQPPKTYAELREYAKKITEAGKGKFYGFIEGGKQVNRWTVLVQDWSSLAGDGLSLSSPVNVAIGEISYDTPAVKGVFNLFRDIYADGSFHPNTMSISAPEARVMFAQNQAAFIVQGAWCIGVWDKNNPELEYGVMAPPVPDSGRKGSLPLLSASPWVGIYADSKHPEEAALYLKEYYGGGYFQPEKVAAGDGISIVKGVNEKYITSPQLKEYFEISMGFGRKIPEPTIRNADSTSVFAEYKEVNPNLGALMSGYVGGAVKDLDKALSDYTKQTGAAWSKAVEASKAKGNRVDASDFVFPNWNPMENYTEDDYKALN